jgi:SAM-dependent methyltransferase
MFFLDKSKLSGDSMESKKTNMYFTGERIIPELENYFFKEHLARYKLVTGYVNRESVLLDVGCGNGYGTFFLSSYVKKAVGIDISAETIAQASKIYKRPNLSFHVINREKNWSHAEEFDTAICFEVFEHVSNPENLLSNIKKFLRDEGQLIISTPNRDVFGEKIKTPFHVREYSLDEFIDFLSRYFVIKEVLGQRNKKPWVKKWNFWISGKAMRFPFILKFYNWYISKKQRKYLEPGYFERVHTDDNYFSMDNAESADYFVVICQKMLK